MAAHFQVRHKSTQTEKYKVSKTAFKDYLHIYAARRHS